MLICGSRNLESPRFIVIHSILRDSEAGDLKSATYRRSTIVIDKKTFTLAWEVCGLERERQNHPSEIILNDLTCFEKVSN